jgi:hypothetical protein
MTLCLSFKVFLDYQEIKEMLECLDVLVGKVYLVKAVCKTNFIISLI